MRTTLCFPAYFRVVGHSNFDFGAVPDAWFDKTNNHPNLLLWPAVFAIPAHCPENDFSLKMPPFELMHIALHPRRLSFTHHCHGRISPIRFFATRPLQYLTATTLPICTRAARASFLVIHIQPDASFPVDWRTTSLGRTGGAGRRILFPDFTASMSALKARRAISARER